MNPHPLDRPVWNALNTGWSPLASGARDALRLDPNHGPFAAAANGSPQSQAALAALVPRNGELWIVEAEPIQQPAGTLILRSAELVQMIANTLDRLDLTLDFIDLGEADASEMLALATLTKPGPFAKHTHRLGQFIGLRRDGTLVAMAGERMHLPGFTEVSGVCTHPGHRGRGYAGTLLRIVAQRIIARGEIPFLHSYAGNSGAIALYESLGFMIRRKMHMMVLGTA